MFDLAYELRKCTKDCYVEVAIKELNRYEQAMDSIGIPGNYSEKP